MIATPAVMFVGATLLAIGYQIFTGWVAAAKAPKKATAAAKS